MIEDENWEDLTDDETDKEEEKMYDLNPWPKESKEKSGYVFKGKQKKFIKSVENFKLKLKRDYVEKLMMWN